MRLKLTAKFETSNHDGYCSGNECEYECETITKIIDTDIDFNEIYEKDGRYFILNTSVPCWEKYFEKEFASVDNSGSGYCDNSTESVKNNLGCHDCRVMPLEIEVLDIFKKKDCNS